MMVISKTINSGVIMIKQIFVLLASILLVSVAKAGFYLDPYVGYNMGTVKYTTVGGAFSDKGTMNGAVYGLGLGYMFGSGFILGADLQGASLTDEYDGATSSSNMTQLGTYAILGWNFDKAFKLYLGYGTFNSEDDASPKNKVTGTATKLGGSYQFSEHFAAGLEYVMYTLDKVNSADYKTLFDKYDTNGIILTLRFPFDLGK